MLDRLKRALLIPIQNQQFDDMLNDLISYAKSDLEHSGVVEAITDDLYIRTVIIYCVDNWNISPSEVKMSLAYLQNIVKLRDEVLGSA